MHLLGASKALSDSVGYLVSATGVFCVWRFALVGANWNNGDNVGPWTLNLNNAASNANVNIGSRIFLSLKIKII